MSRSLLAPALLGLCAQDREALISSADTVVFVVSPDAVASDVALREVAHAASLNKRLAPIICVDAHRVPERMML